MKTPHAPFLAILICNLLLITTIVKGQSVTIGAISGSQFCAGDPISVTFTATGMWQHNNAFTFQLSNDSGTFDQGLQDLGSIKDTIPGTFSIVATMPLTVDYGTQYRVRVIGASPYMESADNGSDLAIGEHPVNFDFTQITAYEVGIPAAIFISPNPTPSASKLASDTIYWNFGSGASPSGGVQTGYSGANNNDGSLTTTYSTAGLKTVVVRSVAPGDCTASDTFYTYLYDCTNPVIPHNVIVDSSNNLNIDDSEMQIIQRDTQGGIDCNRKSFWVQPGDTLSGGGYDTIYAEAGSIIHSGLGNIVYLNKGAMYSGNEDAMVIYSEDASASGISPSFQCPDLAFDYTVAPPNSIMHINDGSAGVAIANTALEQITLSPNPTNGIVAVQGVPLSAQVQVQVMNVLGVAVQELARKAESNFTLDLSKLVPGTYYIRFSLANSVVTKKVVRE